MNLKAHMTQAAPTTLPTLLHLCKPYLILHKARLTCFLMLVLTVIKQRTNWKFGKTHINIPVVTLIVNGVGYPIAWRMLPKRTKRGNSRKIHRIAIVKEVLEMLSVEDMRVLTMDREFVGEKWLGWFKEMKAPYIVRVKMNAHIGAHSTAWLSARNRW